MNVKAQTFPLVDVFCYTKLAGMYEGNIVLRRAEAGLWVTDLTDHGELEVIAVGVEELIGQEMAKKTLPHARLRACLHNALVGNNKVNIDALRIELANLIDILKEGHGPLDKNLPLEGKGDIEVLLINALRNAWSDRREAFDYTALENGFRNVCNTLVSHEHLKKMVA